MSSRCLVDVGSNSSDFTYDITRDLASIRFQHAHVLRYALTRTGKRNGNLNFGNASPDEDQEQRLFFSSACMHLVSTFGGCFVVVPWHSLHTATVSSSRRSVFLAGLLR
jgi:hypothetical protein